MKPAIAMALTLLGCWLAPLLTRAGTISLASVVDEDAARFTRRLDSPVEGRVIEGIQGLSHLKYYPAESALLRLLNHESQSVRREAVEAICRLGTAAAVPALIQLLDDPCWAIREKARLGLERMTGRSFASGGHQSWQNWWQSRPVAGHIRELFEELEKTSVPERRQACCEALRHLAQPGDEDALLAMLSKTLKPPLTPTERNALAGALERMDSAKAVPVLALLRTEAAAWALGRIGGPEAEAALLAWPPTLPVLLNLDRMGSGKCGPLTPHLIRQMGLVTYRGQPDDLFMKEAQPIQRVGANLILRGGRASELVELVLAELEATMNPPRIANPRPGPPADLAPLLEAMREELKPGFVRNDGVTTSQPLTAMYMTARDRSLAPRLIPLLEHPAFVPRIYVAMTLGKLQAAEAIEPIAKILRQGYPFSDATALASGKHFDQSQTVRWRGFLCLALGRIGGDDARKVLESLAADPNQPRDVRYGAVVGLGFLSSPQSLPVLRRVAAEDIIWMVREAARQAMDDIADTQLERATK